MNVYENSRMNFYSKLVDQISVSSGENLYDKNNRVTKMIFLGLPKEKIKSYLMQNSIFRANLESLENSMQITNPIEKAALIRFKDFYEALDGLEDLEQIPDYRSDIASRLEQSYPTATEAISLTKSGADPEDIFSALNKDEKWSDDSWDYMTRADVEIPKYSQRQKWARFRQIIDSINDLHVLNNQK